MVMSINGSVYFMRKFCENLMRQKIMLEQIHNVKKNVENSDTKFSRK